MQGGGKGEWLVVEWEVEEGLGRGKGEREGCLGLN